MKIVRFRNGRYGIRRYRLCRGWQYARIPIYMANAWVKNSVVVRFVRLTRDANWSRPSGRRTIVIACRCGPVPSLS